MQQTPNVVVHVWYQAAVVQDISSFYNTSSLDNYIVVTSTLQKYFFAWTKPNQDSSELYTKYQII